MKFWDFAFVLVLFEIIPLSLLITILRRYRGLESAAGANSVLARATLVWLVLPIGALLVLGVVAILPVHLGIPKTLQDFLPSLWTIASVNCVLCGGSLVTAMAKTKTDQNVKTSRAFIGRHLVIDNMDLDSHQPSLIRSGSVMVGGKYIKS